MKDLISLVQSLSPTEKQHFKKRHNPKADFVLLFDYINKKNSLVTSEVISYISNKQGSKKTLNSSYLSVVKTYLKNRILESLRIQFINKRKNYELLSRSMNTDILLEKGLYSLAKSELETSSDKNLKSSFPIERLLLLRRKSILDYFENYSETNLDGIESLFKQRLDTAEQLILEIKFARIISIMSFQYFNGLNDPEILQKFMDEPYMHDESLCTDFATKYLFHWVHAQFAEFKNNNEEAMVHFNKSIKIWLDSPSYIEAHPRLYLGACFTYFKYLIHQKDPFSNLLNDINFDVLTQKIKTENLSKEEEDKYTFLFSIFEILSLRQQGKTNEIIRYVEPILEDKNSLTKVADFEKVVLYFYSALAYFNQKNYKNAGNILIDLLNPPDHRLASNPLYVSIFTLFHLMTLLELQNEKHLAQLIPKYKKFLTKEGKMGSFETSFFNMAAQLIAPRYKLNPDLVYTRFHTRLLEAQEIDNKGIKHEHGYIVEWVQQKVTQYS